MAGSASTNGWLGILAIFLILAWKVAGWYGLDRWLLPILGTPWQPGELTGALSTHSDAPLEQPARERERIAGG